MTTYFIICSPCICGNWHSYLQYPSQSILNYLFKTQIETHQCCNDTGLWGYMTTLWTGLANWTIVLSSSSPTRSRLNLEEVLAPFFKHKIAWDIWTVWGYLGDHISLSMESHFPTLIFYFTQNNLKMLKNCSFEMLLCQLFKPLEVLT